MAVYKLVFAGPVGAGKTTAVQALSDIEVVSTESVATDETRRLKRTTTVAMDYGVMRLDNGDQVHLYGTPGQKRFDFMWEILAETALGLVLLLKGDAADPVADLRTYVNEFRSFIDQTGLVVGITHAEAAAGRCARWRGKCEPGLARRYGSRSAQPRAHGHLGRHPDPRPGPGSRRRTGLSTERQ